MSDEIQIYFGDAPAVPSIADQNNVVIIGKTASFSGIINNIGSIADVETYLLSTDPLYKAIDKFLGAVGGKSKVIAYAIPATAAEMDGEEFYGDKDGENLIFRNQYSPLSGVTTGQKFYLMQTGFMFVSGSGEFEALTGVWYDITSGWTDNTVNAIYNGSMTIAATGYLTLQGSSGASTGTVTGILPQTDADRIIADVTPLPLGIAFQELIKPDYTYQFLVFAYDHELTGGANPTDDATFKHNSGYCIGGKSWLHDIFLGRNMVDQLVANQKPCMFAFSLPEFVKPRDIITGVYTAGTSYNTNLYKFEELPGMIADEFVFCGVSKQLPDINAIDPAIDLVALRMLNIRQTTTYMQGAIAQLEYHDNLQCKQFLNAHINPWKYFNTTSATDRPRWGGNWTFGTSSAGKINYVQVRNYVSKMIRDQLWACLFNHPGYTYQGVKTVRASIEAAGQEAYSILKIIDSPFTVTIPMEQYLQNEANLSPSDALIVSAGRASTTLDNIIVTYLFGGDIENIIIDSLVGLS